MNINKCTYQCYQQAAVQASERKCADVEVPV